MTGKTFWLSLALTAVLLVAAPAQQRSPSAEELLGGALHQEEVAGNLEEAIAIYQKIVATGDANRALAARAQFRIGACYEKLGKAEARKAYERVLRDYGDQREVAAEARARLAALGQPAGFTDASGPVVRRVWVGFGGTAGAPSPDGRYLSFIDWDTGDLAVRDLASGENRRLTNKGSWYQSNESAQASAPSPDGKQVAYTWRNTENYYELRVIGLDGSKPRVLYHNEEVSHPRVAEWSPDSKHILAHFLRKDGTNQIVLVSLADGSVRVLKSLGWRYPGKPSFSPDGRYIAYDLPSREDSPQRDIFVLSTDGSRETMLVTHPADDFLLGWAPDGQRILFASDRTGTTDAWVIPVLDGKRNGAPELTRKDIGKVRPMGFTRKGSFYYVVFTGANDVYIATLDLAKGKLLAAPERAAQRFVSSNHSPGWSPDGEYLAYISLDSNMSPGYKALSILSVATGKQRELSPKLNWFYRPRWSPDARSILVQGADEKNRPGLYQVDAQTGDVTVVVQSDGNTSIRSHGWFPDGKAIFYTRADVGHKLAQFVVRDLQTGQEKDPIRGPRTLAACLALSPDGRQLACLAYDEATRSVVLQAMPASGGESRELLKVQPPERISELAWTPDGRGILFVKARGIGLAEIRELWRVPTEGGDPQSLGLAMGQMRDLQVHPDGQRIAFTAGQGRSEIWVMENFLPTLKAER